MLPIGRVGVAMPAGSVFTRAALAASPSRAVKTWTPYDRPAQYGVVVEKDVRIPMRDGVVLVADVYRPDAPGRFPVLVTQTPYNKNGSLGAGNRYFVERGYVHVVVDVRGTGGSGGVWESFGEAEQRDGYEIVEWAARQPWSSGKVGLWGASYMAINQFFTAAQQPPHLRALFPIVPMADSYRDIVMTGGQVNTAFIPMWLGLVTGAGLVPPSDTAADPVRASGVLMGHLGGALAFEGRTLAATTLGGDEAYDGPFHRLRSPIEVIDRVRVPAFIVGGLHDIFQRGEPLLYEALRRRGVTAKLLIGPWTHGDFGSGLPADGVPALDQIALRWFDHYLKGMNTRVDAIPDVTQYMLGRERYEVQPDWPHPRLTVQRLYLRAAGALTPQRPVPDEPADRMLQHPLNGACSASTNQWLIGALGSTPCARDNRLTELGEITYTTAPMTREMVINGPIAAHLWVQTTAREAVVSVRVTEVAPDGTSTELTAGLLAASFRAVDRSRSRIIGGAVLQPWHPFTRASVEPVTPGEPMLLQVEIFPTSAVIRPGHRLRIAVGPSDFPHAASPVPQLLGQAGGIVTILHDAAHPSHVVLPVVPR